MLLQAKTMALKDSEEYLSMRSNSHSHRGCIRTFGIQNSFPLFVRICRLIIHLLFLWKYPQCTLSVLSSSSTWSFLWKLEILYVFLSVLFPFFPSSPSKFPSPYQFLAFMIIWPSRETWLEIWKPPNVSVLNNALWLGMWSYKASIKCVSKLK